MNLHIHIIQRKDAKARGLKRYFTAQACKYGHFSERRTSVGHCVECLRLVHQSPKEVAKKKERYLANKTHVLAKCKQWRLDNTERKHKTQREYYENNKERIQEKVAQWRLDNPEAFREQCRRLYQKDVDKSKAQRRAYYRNNKDVACANSARRRCKMAAHNTIGPAGLTDFVMLEASRLCKERQKLTGFKWQVDHCIPLKGKNFSGLHVYYNLQCLPAKINSYKQSRLIFTEPYEWVGADI